MQRNQIISFKGIYAFVGGNSLLLLWSVQHQYTHSTMMCTKLGAAPGPRVLAMPALIPAQS